MLDMFFLGDLGSCYKSFFKKWAIYGLFLFICIFSNKHYIFLQQINVKNIHPVYGAGIRTNDLWSMSLLPLPLDQGSRP